MSRGRNNHLTGQIAEHLVVSELGRRGFAATGFSGNVPTFDVLAVDKKCRVVPIQVKATTADNWITRATTWMNVDLEKDGLTQRSSGPTSLSTPNLIYVCVKIASHGSNQRDRYFVLAMKDLQQVCIKAYTDWMDTISWKRPKNPKSFECRYTVQHLREFEDNWAIIEDRLVASEPDPALASASED